MIILLGHISNILFNIFLLPLLFLFFFSCCQIKNFFLSFKINPIFVLMAVALKIQICVYLSLLTSCMCQNLCLPSNDTSLLVDSC